jgi:uncharacterized protein YhhL (DUF1145 family)
MKHIESSKLINLSGAVETSAIKHSLVERMRNIFHIETIGEGLDNFSVSATGKDIPCHCMFNVMLKTDERYARLIVDGSAEITAAIKIIYTLGVLVLLVLGLFPGTINTTGHGSATDLMVFLFLGIFILYDMNKKLAEPEIMLDRILRAVATEFGT